MLAEIISYALVLHSVVPLRSTPSEGAEQETQLLFGETCQIVEEKGGWVKVENDYDGQIGWADALMITRVSEEEYKEYRSSNLDAIVVYPLAYAYCEKNPSPLTSGRAPLTPHASPISTNTIPLSAGSHLSNYREVHRADGSVIGEFDILGTRFTIDAKLVSPKPLELTQENVYEVVSRFINIPYLWGGKSSIGLDCSGFAGVVLHLFGKNLLRNAREQATQGTEVKSLKDAQAGDLVFFNREMQNPEATRITHVGILLSPTMVAHCSGRVKVEPIDEDGIFSFERGKHYTHTVKVIKRY